MNTKLLDILGNDAVVWNIEYFICTMKRWHGTHFSIVLEGLLMEDLNMWTWI